MGVGEAVVVTAKDIELTVAVADVTLGSSSYRYNWSGSSS